MTLLQSPQAQGETHPLPHPCTGKWRQDKLQPQLLLLPQVHQRSWHQRGQNLALAPHVWGVQGLLADPVPAGGVWTLHRSQFLAIKTVPASAEPVCGARGSSARLGLSRCCRDGEHSVWAQVCPGATHWGQGDTPAPWAGPLASTWAGLAFKGNGGLALSCSLSSNSRAPTAWDVCGGASVAPPSCVPPSKLCPNP